MLSYLNPSDYKPRSDDENVKSFADLSPQNKLLWVAKSSPQSNLYRLYKVISQELRRYQILEAELVNTYIPNFSTSLIESWEEFLGIPDDCFTNDGTDAIRRRNIIIKLAYLNIQTASDIIALGAILGLVVQVFPNIPTDPYIWTINVISNDPNVFTYTFPILFEDNYIELFQCLMNKQKPAYTEILYTFSGFTYVSNNLEEYVDNDNNPYIGGAAV